MVIFGFREKAMTVLGGGFWLLVVGFCGGHGGLEPTSTDTRDHP